MTDVRPRAGDGRRDRRRLRHGPRRHAARRHARRRRPRRGAARRRTRSCRVLGIDRDEQALGRGAAPAARASATGSTTVHSRFDRLAEVIADDRHRRPVRRAVRPRRVVAAARPGRAWLQLPQRRPARHAHGPHAAGSPPPTSSTATTRPSSPASSATTATSASPAASPGRSSPPDRSRRPPSSPRSCHGGDPGGELGARAATRPSARSRRCASRSTASSTQLPARSTRRSTRPCRPGASPC